MVEFKILYRPIEKPNTEDVLRAACDAKSAPPTVRAWFRENYGPLTYTVVLLAMLVCFGYAMDSITYSGSNDGRIQTTP
jgi:hypothetical protein